MAAYNRPVGCIGRAAREPRCTVAVCQKGIRMALSKMPKRVDPATHAFLDYAVAASFLIMGVVFWKRSKRAAIGSLLCGGAATANIMFTDYPGSGSRKP